MTQKKSIASKLLLAAIALTLISFCFLGSTFARYTSSNGGQASLNVAKWEVTHDFEEETTTAVFGSLSPSKDVYESTPRTNSTGKILVATITNSGDVDALVTVSAVEPPSLWNGESEVSSFGDDYTKEEIQGLFSIKLYKGTSSDASASTALQGGENVTAKGGILYIFAEVIWTSDVGDTTGDDADARDTWVGENITKVSYNISYTAVQNSELPNASA